MLSKYTPNTQNLLHQRFGMLTAIGYAGRPDGSHHTWLWKCDCGNYKVMRADVAKRWPGCGCQRGLKTGSHFAARGGQETQEYRAWHSMKSRCLSATHAQYSYYGGRGITIHKPWIDSFQVFLDDVGLAPSPNHSLDRFPNNDGNYEPSNVRWATNVEQSRNRRSTRWITFNGETLCLTEWAQRIGITKKALHMRLGAGWSIARALTTPPKLR